MAIDPEFPVLRFWPGGLEEALDVVERRSGKRPHPSAVRMWRYSAKEMPCHVKVALMFELNRLAMPYTEEDFKLRSEDATREEASAGG